MEEKKIGMKWYYFLRYFTFGLGRVLPLIFMGLYLLVTFVNFNFATLFTAGLFFLCFALLFVTHRHLENYSKNAGKWVCYPYLIEAILSFVAVLFALVASPESLIDIISSAIASTVCFVINYIYFKKRSHIFVNKCNFFGKLVGTPVIVETDSVKEQYEYVSEQPIIKNAQPEYKFCRICGNKIDLDAKFCPYCGTKVEE